MMSESVISINLLVYGNKSRQSSHSAASIHFIAFDLAWDFLTNLPEV